MTYRGPTLPGNGMLTVIIIDYVDPWILSSWNQQSWRLVSVLVLLYIQQIFTEFLVFVRHYAGCPDVNRNKVHDFRFLSQFVVERLPTCNVLDTLSKSYGIRSEMASQSMWKIKLNPETEEQLLKWRRWETEKRIFNDPLILKYILSNHVSLNILLQIFKVQMI